MKSDKKPHTKPWKKWKSVVFKAVRTVNFQDRHVWFAIPLTKDGGTPLHVFDRRWTGKRWVKAEGKWA